MDRVPPSLHLFAVYGLTSEKYAFGVESHSFRVFCGRQASSCGCLRRVGNQRRLNLHWQFVNAGLEVPSVSLRAAHIRRRTPLVILVFETTSTDLKRRLRDVSI